jgi:hypothetical protein
MIRRTTLDRLAPAVFWLAVLPAAGCRDEAPGFASFVPEPAAARAAVVAALDAWKRGEPPDSVVGKDPTVNVVDKQRPPGRPLTRYEILGEVSAENARGFAVRLGFEGGEESPVVRYLVVGRGPVWVFRQEDYDMISHWTHPMGEPQDTAKGPGPSP